MSKFKAAHSQNLPRSLADHLGSAEFALLLLDEVLATELRIENPAERPAEHIVQVPDATVQVREHVFGIELTLSKVSVRDGRFFKGALLAMERLLIEAVEDHCDPNTAVQIFCVIQTDTPVPGTTSTLFEMEEARWIRGKNAVVS
jgi:hypothetical protein